MEKILWYLSWFDLDHTLKVERKDRQFQALETLYNTLKQKEYFLDLILANATVWYLLSSSWEDYWEEFAQTFWNKNFLRKQDIIREMFLFLPLSKGNKRLKNHKTKRLQKLAWFLDSFQDFIKKENINFIEIQHQIAIHMKQNPDSKTIVYTIKMLSYWVRIIKNRDIILPFEITIPIDSRLTKIYELFNTNKKISIKDFYTQISKKTNIPPIHLDGILWTNYKEILTLK